MGGPSLEVGGGRRRERRVTHWDRDGRRVSEGGARGSGWRRRGQVPAAAGVRPAVPLGPCPISRYTKRDAGCLRPDDILL